MQHAVLKLMPDEMPVDTMRWRRLPAGGAEFLQGTVDGTTATAATFRFNNVQWRPPVLVEMYFPMATHPNRNQIDANTRARVTALRFEDSNLRK